LVTTGYNGFILFNVSNPAEMNPLKSWSRWPTQDFIWGGRYLLTMGFPDFRTYDIGDPQKPLQLGQII